MGDSIFLYGLIFKCPFVERIADCPFLEIDKQSINEKIHWIDNLSELNKVKLLTIHSCCSMNRERK